MYRDIDLIGLSHHFDDITIFKTKAWNNIILDYQTSNIHIIVLDTLFLHLRWGGGGRGGGMCVLRGYNTIE